MNATRLENYKRQLLEIDKRVGGDINELSGEIASAGVVVGEHTSRNRESLETEITLEQNEESIQQNVRLALQRIESGKFGDCEDCGDTIAKARLDVLPYTPICIDCERKREAGKSRPTHDG